MIVDFRLTPPIPEGLGRYVEPPPHMAGYSKIYGGRVFGGETAEVHCMKANEFVGFLDEQGVDIGVLKTSDTTSTIGKKFPAEKLVEYVDGFRDRFLLMAGADPHQGMDAVRYLEYQVKSLGYQGLNIGPFEHKLLPNDKRYYPLYSKCVELSVPVLIHTSINFSTELRMDTGRPLLLDEVAVDFPELKIVAVHGGWPWVQELIGVCWKNPNVYIEISGTRPKYINTSGTGWEPLLRYGDSVLQHKVVWGSNWPMVTPAEGIKGVHGFPLKEEIKKQWLGLNAAEIFNLRTEHCNSK